MITESCFSDLIFTADLHADDWLEVLSTCRLLCLVPTHPRSSELGLGQKIEARSSTTTLHHSLLWANSS